jgi:hypothetical protein
MSVNQTYRGKVELLNTGEYFEEKFIGVTTPGSGTDLIDYEVPSDKNLLLLQVYASCRIENRIMILSDTTEIGSIRLGPGHINGNFNWQPYRVLEDGEHLIINNLSMAGRPASDIEVFIQGRLIPKP